MQITGLHETTNRKRRIWDKQFTCVLALWASMRRPVIGCAVFLHFGIGLLCFVQAPSIILEIPSVAPVIEFYRRNDFGQTWRMFAPPSQTYDEIGYSLKLPQGWTPLLSMNQFLLEQAAGRFILPRGYIRVANHLRHPIFRERHLKDEPFFVHYFQQLSAFFFFGDGAIPKLEAIRFYSVVKGVPPFFPTDGHGKKLPEASDFDKVEPIYERWYSDR